MKEWDVFRLAVQFLTRVRVGNPAWSEGAQAASIRWFSVVGLLIGAAGGGVFWLASLVLPGTVAAALSTASVLLLGGGMTRERALEIMRDSRIGSYGAAAMTLAIVTKVAVLGSMPTSVAVAALVAGHAASRASVVVVVATSRYVRDHGTGKPVSQGVGPGGLTLALGGGAVGLVVLGMTAGWLPVLGAVIGLVVGHLGMRWFFERRLGGYTGDCLGATQQTSELGLLVGVLACL